MSTLFKMRVLNFSLDSYLKLYAFSREVAKLLQVISVIVLKLIFKHA